MRRYTTLLPVALILPTLMAVAAARAAEVSGIARVYGGGTTRDGGSEDLLSQDYNLRLDQPITPWLRLFVTAQASRFDITSSGTDFDRKTTMPSVDLSYHKDTFFGRIGYRDRKIRSSILPENFDIKSSYAQFSWKPARGPQFTLRHDKSSNIADVAVFGRDVDTTSSTFEVWQTGRTWSTRYSFRTFDLKNNMTTFELEQDRHELQSSYQNGFLDNRMRLSVEMLLRRAVDTQMVPDGDTFAEPLPAVEGLALFDLTPGIGTLDPSPDLIDGDFATPVVPNIDIGGANTFWNIGLDLGFTRQVSRLEVAVNAISDPMLLWAVYEGPDNLTWTPIGGITTIFDPVFLRYTIRFPETTNRYFKVVNLSINSQSNVLVTETRALVDTTRTGTDRRKSDTRRLYVTTDFLPGQRVSGGIRAGFEDDTGSGEDLIDRDNRDMFYEGFLYINMTPTLDARIQFNRTDSERAAAPTLKREVTRYNATLSWNPLPTVSAFFTAFHDEETEQGALIRRTDSLRANVLTDLLPGLRVTSVISLSQVDDPFSGFDSTTFTWSELFDTRPYPSLTLYGGWSIQRFDTSGGFNVSGRESLHARIDWVVTPVIGFGGDWSYGSEDGRDTLTQRYNLRWTPGPRLSLSGSYIQTDSARDFQTSTFSAYLSYRVNRHFDLFASTSTSEVNRFISPSTSITSVQYGLVLTF